ncbi:glycosyltransferase family 32 protein [Lactiplantibacillus plantarum]|uniref:glycosyltransferase family 32 protein n=1 Tax=Lactiplantibacillus plantarum TaxID=1590 RepID=UPI0012F97F1C|nr:glycosyltransferase [Lactiplantibacillus plantarum]KAE9504091.1 hypothetical protein FET70_03463 [Lactiplantibacillus plantarum]
MIPKKIHYVWFGNKEKSKNILKCIDTWKRYLPDYEIVEWNENNFDVNSNPFVKEAYDAKKWAFVSDYVRMYAIYTQGGIYLDTDVLVLHSFDSLLNSKTFVGFEDSVTPFSAVFGAEPENEFVAENLRLYDSLKFDSSTEGMKSLVNTNMAAEILIDKFGCIPKDSEQKLQGGIHVYPSGVLCQPSYRSISIHVMSASWKNSKMDILRRFRRIIRQNLTTRKRAAVIGFLRLLHIPF